MPTSLIDADSMLVLDIGSVTTRATLFDVVDGRYRFLAAGEARTTAGAPFHDISEGVHIAFESLQSITGRTLMGEDGRLIIPSKEDGSGIDRFAVTLSVGPPLKIVAVGLLDDVSLDSACRLATTTYGNLVEVMGLTDRRKIEARIDTILRIRPDLILVAGGTEGGASQSVLKLLEPAGLACYLLPESQRPEVLFAGNQELHDEVKGMLGKLVNLHFAANIRPALGVEQLDPAQTRIAEITCRIRARQIPGVRELSDAAGGNILPTAYALGRLIRFLSKAYASPKGVLGIELGASATTLAAAFQGNLALSAYPQFGLGSSLSRLLEHVQLSEITRWLPVELSNETVREYLYNKSLYPATLPMTPEETALEEALARTLLNSAVRQSMSSFQSLAPKPGGGLLPWFEPIMATGGVLTHAPNMAHTLMMLLDGLQPTGATTLVLDQNHLAAALGAAASANPVLVAQVLDSTTFLYLGTVISPVSSARPGTPILRIKMKYESDMEANLDIKQGGFELIPLPLGQTAQLQMRPLHRTDVGMGGPGRGGRLNVHGGTLGVIIDARGRPLQLPEDPGRRRELHKKWLWTLGG